MGLVRGKFYDHLDNYPRPGYTRCMKNITGNVMTVAIGIGLSLLTFGGCLYLIFTCPCKRGAK